MPDGPLIVAGGPKPRLLFIQPSLQPPGGGNALAAWMLEALRHDHDVTLFTWRPLDAPAVDRFCGTALTGVTLSTRTVPSLVRWVLDAVPLPLNLLKSAVLVSFARRVMPAHDLVVSAENEMNFGRTGLQYVHYPRLRRPRPVQDLSWYHRLPFVLPLYYLVCDRYMRGWSEGIRDNLTLVNSDWTGAWFRSVHGGVTTTCYPPVSGAFPDVPWDDRDPTFLCLGRIAHEKNLDAVIDIVAEVRRTWPEVRLRVVGSAYADAYSAHILARMARHADWITVHLDVSHAEVRTLISRCRYGLHGMHHEHFGMAPAEMVTGGCLVWVHDSGGQVEVVGREPRLVYTTVEDGVQRILRVLADERAQAELRAHLAARARLFSLDAFSSGVRGAAARQLARQADAAATSARNSG